MITIEVYSRHAYRKVSTARTRDAAFLALSLVKGRARAKDINGKVIANRHETDGARGKLSLVK